VTIVGNGKEAVAAAESGAFDLIVMDVQMPEMDGLEAASIIRRRQKETDRKVPIMALTAHAAPEDRERCRAAGMDGYLSKPLRIADLEGGIERLFESASGKRGRSSKRNEPKVAANLIDEKRVLEGLGGDRELFVDVLQLFLQDSERLLQKIQAAGEAKDPVELGHSAHALKGSIANLSSGPAHQYAAELERMGKSGECDSASEVIAKLQDALRQLQGAATQILSHNRIDQGKRLSTSGAA
jgi:CheY-like chemotaxis protein